MPSTSDLQMLRVYRERDLVAGATDRWVAIPTRGGRVHPPHEYATVDDMPEPLRTNLALLLVADNGASLPDIGRRIDNDVFWVYGE